MIGYGNIGHALYQYKSFSDLGYRFEAVFDKEAKLVSENDLEVRDVNKLGEFLANNKIDIGIIATPKEVAQEVADVLCEGGIKGIWNFSPVDLKVSNGVVIELSLIHI